MITVMIPAYNEEKRLAGTIENLIVASKRSGRAKLDIIIVNDASCDNTQNVIDQLEKKYSFVRHIQHARNAGVGKGIKEAIAIAKYEKFIVIPGDNVVAQDLITLLFQNRNKADVVVSYFLNKEIRSVKRNFISGLYTLIYDCTFGVYVQYLNGVTIYQTDFLKKLYIRSNRFSVIAELTIKSILKGASFHEVSGVYVKEGMVDSTSFSLKSLLEVISMYILMLYEIKFKRKREYAAVPFRIP